MLQLVAAQTTVTNTYADGSYCLHCSGATALDALGCDLAFIFSGCFFGALFGGTLFYQTLKQFWEPRTDG
jgi:hypothetical protein